MSDSNLTEAQREQVARAKQAAEELAAEKSGIPDVLKPLIETHEEDGSPFAVCDPGCGRTRVACLDSDDYWSAWGWVADDCAVCEYDTEHMDCLPVHGFCPGCGILVGFTDDGRPYRIRLTRVVEALERVQDAANCAWALLPAAQRVQMYHTYPRLAELASEGYMSADRWTQ